MARFWETPKFKQLAKEWEKKLEKAGFDDAETTVRGERFLTQYTCSVFRGSSLVALESKREYYQRIGNKLDCTAFDDEVERLVMQRVAEGLEIKAICIELKALKVRCHRHTVRVIIRKYENLWKIRRWTKEQIRPPWRKRRAPTR